MPFAVTVENQVLLGERVKGRHNVRINGTVMAVIKMEDGEKFRIAIGKLPLGAINVVRSIIHKNPALVKG